MSSAGHILDMIIRIRNNEAYRKMIKARYQDLKEQYYRHASRHIEFIDRPKLSEAEMNELKKNIRKDIIKERKSFILKTSIAVFFVLIILSVVIYKFIQYAATFF